MKSFQKSKTAFITKFLWWCSGTVTDILEECPTESAKYQGIGAAVMFTGILASLTGGYALFFVFDRIDYAILFGIFWGLLIFNFNRYIVTSIDKRGGLREQVLAAFPRIILAVFIAFVISKPLELKIFEKEIDQQLNRQYLEQTKKHDDLISEKEKLLTSRYLEPVLKEIGRKEEELAKLKETREKYNQELILEIQGQSNTKRRGIGPAAEQIRQYLDETSNQLATLEADLNSLKEKEDSLTQKKRDVLETTYLANQARPKGGLLARLDALEALKVNSITTRRTDLFIFFLFFFIEISPVFVKLFSSQGIYDELESRAALLEKADVLDNLDHYYKYKEEKREGEIYKMFSDLLQPAMENKIKTKIENWNKESESTYTDLLSWLKQNMVGSASEGVQKAIEELILKPIAAGILFFTSWVLIHLVTFSSNNIKITLTGFLIIFSAGFFIAFLINALTFRKYKDNKKVSYLTNVVAMVFIAVVVQRAETTPLFDFFAPGAIDSPATIAIAMISILFGKFGSDLI